MENPNAHHGKVVAVALEDRVGVGGDGDHHVPRDHVRRLVRLHLKRHLVACPDVWWERDGHRQFCGGFWSPIGPGRRSWTLGLLPFLQHVLVALDTVACNVCCSKKSPHKKKQSWSANGIINDGNTSHRRHPLQRMGDWPTAAGAAHTLRHPLLDQQLQGGLPAPHPLPAADRALPLHLTGGGGAQQGVSPGDRPTLSWPWWGPAQRRNILDWLKQLPSGFPEAPCSVVWSRHQNPVIYLNVAAF